MERMVEAAFAESCIMTEAEIVFLLIFYAVLILGLIGRP